MKIELSDSDSTVIVVCVVLFIIWSLVISLNIRWAYEASTNSCPKVVYEQRMQAEVEGPTAQ